MALINWKYVIKDINYKYKMCQIYKENSIAYAYSLGQLLLEIQSLFSNLI